MIKMAIAHNQPLKRTRSRSKLRNFKNLIVVSIGVAIQYAVFSCSLNLISSFRIENGLGSKAEIILNVVVFASVLFVPVLLMKYLGFKYCVVAAMLMYSVSMVGNFKPILPVYAATSVINGLGASIYWVSIGNYVLSLAEDFADPGQLNSSKFAFFGFFITFYQSSNIWGNLVSYKLLETPVENDTMDMDEFNVSEICGVNFCDWYATGPLNILQIPSDEQMKKLSAIFIACAIGSGLFVLFFADPVKVPEKFQKTKVKDLFLSTLKCLKNPYHLLLGPIAFLSGLDISFLMSDFTKAYISCTWGVSHIGYVLVTYGVTSTIFAVVLGYAERKVDRFIFVISGILILGGCVAALAFWTPSSDSKYFLFIVAGFWGFVDSILQGQLKALYGVFFSGDNEASFACLSMFECLGYLVGYSYDSQLCVKPKLIILAGVIGLSLVGYVVAEILYRKKKTTGLKASFNLSQIMNSYNTYPIISNGVEGEIVENSNAHGVTNSGFEHDDKTEF